ncbi:MAG: NUDIX hydrolase [Polyangiaceae bacterium]|nr:NUDIX hydrolase [Polyangiaceae bacterium]
MKALDPKQFNTDGTVAPLRLASTVVLLRRAKDVDSKHKVETLMLRRVARKGGAMGGRALWVFPGGGVEDQDECSSEQDLAALARAGARETQEEAGVEVHATALSFFARWIAPSFVKKRFDTFFFATETEGDSAVQVDGSEIDAAQWLTPEAAIALYQKGELPLVAPTFVTLHWLTGYPSPAAVIEALARAPAVIVNPKVCIEGELWRSLYPGDAGYETSSPDRAGARNRIIRIGDKMTYERSGLEPRFGGG